MQRFRFSSYSLFNYRILYSNQSFFCSNTDNLPDIRKLLRKFYLKVHPDLFSSYPKEQTVNQNSLKELTVFTDEWCKNTAKSTLIPTTKKEITFYLKKRKKDKESINDNKELLDQKEISDNNLFTEHNMTLISNGSFSEVQSQYSRLFEQAGLPTEFIVDGKASSVAEFNFMDEFLTKHKETAREKVKKEEKANTQMKEIIFRLKHYYKISIHTDNQFYNYYAIYNNSVLETLYSAIESLEKSNPNIVKALEGVKIGFDSAAADYAVDYDKGLLYIDREGSAIEYVRNFQKLNISELRQGIENRGKNESDIESEFKRTQRICDNFSKQIGISCIEMAEESSFYTDDYQTDDNGKEKLVYNYEREFVLYKRFARSLEENKRVLSRTWIKGKMKRVKVFIRSLLDDKEYFISSSPSLIISPLVSSSRFLELIHEHGNTINTRLKELEVLRNKMNFIMARMGLESINISYIIESDPDGHKKAVSAINKLEKVAGELRKFDLSGLSIGIDNQYNVESDGSLWIKWNFQMETLKKLMTTIKERQDEEKTKQLKQ